MTNKPKKRKKFFVQFLIIFLATILFIALVSTLAFNYYKDDIAKAVLLRANTIQQGEITFKDISFHPFVHFPDVSLELIDLKYFEKSSVYRFSDSTPMIDLQRLYFAIDILDLIKGDVNVSKISLKNGRVNLITYADSTLNLSNAIGMVSDTSSINSDSVQQISTDFEMNLVGIFLDDISVEYKSIPDDSRSIYKINSLSASFNYLPDTIKCSLTSDMLLEEAKLAGRFHLVNKEMSLNTALKYNRNTHDLRIDPSSFSFERANFITQGNVIFSGDGYIELDLKGNDKDFSMLDSFLSVEGIENVEKGELFFNGSVKGALLKGIPNIECVFGMTDVLIKIPNTNESINNLNIKGDFQSGIKKDFSEARINITELSGILPGGQLDGNFSVTNFVSPAIDMSLYMKADITGFDEIFDLGDLDSISGNIEFKADLQGRFDTPTASFAKTTGSSIIRFDSVSVNIPSVNNLKNIYGRLEFENDTLTFKNFSLDFGKSDFNINGTLTNTLFTFFDVDKPIEGDLHIKANTYDFPDFFLWDQNIATAFPYRINDVKLFVKPRTSTKDLVDFIKAPHIDFNIYHLDAEIEDFLPPVTIQSGVFALGDKDSSLLLEFNDFNITIAGSELGANMTYYSPQADPDWFTINVDISDLNPAQAFVHWFNDSVSDYLNGRLDGELSLEMILSLDSLMDFDKLDFTAHKFDYVNSRDTFDIHSMRIDSRNVSYDLSNSANFMEHLSFEMNLTIDTITTNYFKVDQVDDTIKAIDGVFRIIPNNSQFFDKNAEALVLLNPFDDPPTYEFHYKVEQFDVAYLFETFMEDTILLGRMDIDFELLMAGSGWEEVERNLNGKIHVYGQDLTLLGLDLDKVIERFKRSQRFTFADLGAIFLMGPAGILVTKGTDYARILVLNPGESSEILELSSKWNIENGIVDLTDVAFSTVENRMAAKGNINLAADTLKVEVALINAEGCLVFGQSLSGKLEEPELGKVKVVKSLFAPVTNLVKSASGGDCEVFYDGSVMQPTQNK